nr:50S ribosomal protein L21 [Bacteroidales bacterium]
LLVEEDGKITIGEPTISDAWVDGLVLAHPRGDKVIVFKKKRKKGYRVKNGHRQNLTHVEILTISGKGAIERKAAPAKAVKAADASATEATEKPVKAKKAPAKKAAEAEAEVPARKAPAKKSSEKKPAEKKTAAKKTSKSKE